MPFAPVDRIDLTSEGITTVAVIGDCHNIADRIALTSEGITTDAVISGFTGAFSTELT